MQVNVEKETLGNIPFTFYLKYKFCKSIMGQQVSGMYFGWTRKLPRPQAIGIANHWTQQLPPQTSADVPITTGYSLGISI